MADTTKELERWARFLWQKPLGAVTDNELHAVLAYFVRDRIAGAWQKSRARHNASRRAYYLSAEYLIGADWRNALFCCGLLEETERALARAGLSTEGLDSLRDPALGNGGLGRLAACFLDSAATKGLPLDGYGIRYRCGLFRQRIEDGFQREEPDDWTRDGDPWSVCRPDEAVTVHFASGDVRAVPYDRPIIGYGGKHISTLRLWEAQPVTAFDFDLFNARQYDRAVREKNRAEDISRVLYPNDDGEAGRLLRLRQQYFFCAASLADMMRRFEAEHGADWDALPDWVTVQLNDTHPVIAIPELIRRLTAQGVAFADALSIAHRMFNYTNHTVMPEAMEKWELSLIRKVNPALVGILRKMAAEQQRRLKNDGVPPEEWTKLLFLQENTVYMTYLACWCTTHINGVAVLHTALLRQDVLDAWQRWLPDKIINVTNGITPRRFLGVCDPALTALLGELAGDDAFLTDLVRLQRLDGYAADGQVLARFVAIKQANKECLMRYLEKRNGLTLRPERILDVQIKRLHEYKRQLLNILSVLDIYFALRDGEIGDFAPTTVLFAAKAAPGYVRAKAIIKLIHEVAALIRRDGQVSEMLDVVFVPDYDVSVAEKIVAAADISEQISTAGTEASGTGNMKLMLNGAVTLGTKDGATVEIVHAAGEENNAVFGLRVEDIPPLRENYDPRRYYEQDGRLRRCLDALVDGTLDDGGTGWFRELYTALLDGADWHPADHYFVLADFASYREARCRLNRLYRDDRMAFAAMQWHNLCAAGHFSADRAVAEYAADIWHI